MTMIVGTKFELKLPILIFCTKLAQNRHFRSKKNTSNEFCLLELVLVPSFTVNWQFLVFGTNLAKKGISGRKQKTWASSFNSEHSKQSTYQILGETDNFFFCGPNLPKKGYSGLKQKKWTAPLNSAYSNKLFSVPNFSLKWQF